MADARVEAAIKNWAPRFTSQGVDYNDFVRTTGSIERWEEWLDAWCANGDMHAELAGKAEANGRFLSAGEAWVRAALSYHFAKFVWMVAMDKYRVAADKAVAALYAGHRHLDRTAERVEMDLDGDWMVGNLRRPAGAERPPLVILLPGLDSTKEEFFHWENVYLSRGLATLSLEGPGQGETGYNSHIRPDYEAAVATALDALDGRTDLDPGRVGVVGVSLGGYYAPRAAAFEPRIKAAAPIGGPYNFGECWDSLPMITRETFVHHSGAANEAEGKARARQLTLEGVAGRVQQPMLVVFGKLDRLIPYQHAERLAAEAPNATLVMYEDGNHVCNNIPYKYRPLVADWMKEQLSNVEHGRPTHVR
ncbi:MAG: alpha/beta fold hydrolase [Chloroflexi bacterium]|nr:alpha/beta fold hydrolase [Chloroflexota bacterium]MCI0644888.1 alpha/beta fold hydrolase [Chloroflexota bacterium]MCI0729705.1 alpha/beta fold hydrolase [Chloroflexota bacterium]